MSTQTQTDGCGHGSRGDLSEAVGGGGGGDSGGGAVSSFAIWLRQQIRRPSLPLQPRAGEGGDGLSPYISSDDTKKGRGGSGGGGVGSLHC